MQVTTDIAVTSDESGLHLDALTEILVSHEENLSEMMTSLVPGPGAEIGADEDVRKSQEALTAAFSMLVNAANEGKTQAAHFLAMALQEFVALAMRITANLSDVVTQEAVITAAKEVILQTGDIIMEAMIPVGEGEQSLNSINIMAKVERTFENFSVLCSGGRGSPPEIPSHDVSEEDSEATDEGFSDDEFELVSAGDWHSWYKGQYYIPERVSYISFLALSGAQRVNKHCEILVSCSCNSMQAYATAYKFM